MYLNAVPRKKCLIDKSSPVVSRSGPPQADLTLDFAKKKKNF
jgi:hypothetical protein